jgi:hypothetical protein
MIQPPILKTDSPETTAQTPAQPAAPPIHPLSAGLLVAVDNLWNLADWAVVTWWMTVPLSFLSVFLPTLWLQRQLRKDRWGMAFAKALVLGLVAAIPTSLTGTPVGMALLARAGVDRWRR